MNKIKYLLTVGILAITTSLYSQTSTNSSGGTTTVSNVVPNNPLTAPVAPITTVSNILNAAGAEVAQVGTDGWNVFKTFNLTNPISAGPLILKNGSHFGYGLEANTVDTNSIVNAGFAVLAINQDQTVNGVKSTKFNFYDATLNLSVSTIEKIPVLNIPLTLRIESGPAVALNGNGGPKLLEQSAVFGDVSFEPIKGWPFTFGAGAINNNAPGLATVMPFFHFNITHAF